MTFYNVDAELPIVKNCCISHVEIFKNAFIALIPPLHLFYSIRKTIYWERPTLMELDDFHGFFAYGGFYVGWS